MLKQFIFTTLFISAFASPIPYLLKLTDNKVEIRQIQTYQLNLSGLNNAVSSFEPEPIFTKYRLGKAYKAL